MLNIIQSDVHTSVINGFQIWPGYQGLSLRVFWVFFAKDSLVYSHVVEQSKAPALTWLVLPMWSGELPLWRASC